MNNDILEVLEKARATYGNKNQILVCMEELNELACVLAKYPRFDDENKATQELFNKVLDEVADVTIVLEHVKSIFHISEEDLSDREYKKVSRLNRWLNNSNSMQETVDDRTIETTMCTGCIHKGCSEEQEFADYCRPCVQAQATEGIAPFHAVE